MAQGVRDIVVRFIGDPSQLGQASKEAGSKMEKFSKVAGAAGAAAAAAFSVGMAGAFEAEDSLAKLKANAGGAQWAAAAGDAAAKLYGNAYGESMEAVSGAVTKVIREGLVGKNATSEIIQGVTAQAQSLADAFDQDVGGIAKAAGQALKTGLVKDADEAFDVLARGFQLGGDKAEDLLDTFNEYGTQFRKLGLDAKSATGLIIQGLEGGARDADIVADALKEFSIRARTADKDLGTFDANAAAGFEELGLNAQKMAKAIGGGGSGANAALAKTLDRLRAIKDPLKREAIAVRLFGTQAEDLGDALFKLDPTKATAKLGDLGQASEEVDKIMGSTTKATLTAFTRQVKQELSTAVAGAIPYIQGFARAIQPYKGIIVPLVAALAALAATIWTVNAATKAYRATVLAIAAVKRAWTAVTLTARIAQLALNAAMRANPIGAVITVLTLLVAGVVLAYKKFDWFRAGVNKVWSIIRDAFGWVKNNWPTILAILTGPVGLAILAISKNFDRIKGFVQDALNKVKGVFNVKALVQTGVDFIQGFLNGLIEKAKDIPGVVKDKVVGAAKSVITSGFGIFSPSKVTRRYGQYVVEGFTLGVKDKAGKAKEAMAAMVQAAKDKIGEAKEVARQIREAFRVDLALQQETTESGATRDLPIIESLRRQADQAEAFAKKIQELRKKGLLDSLVDQLVAEGPGSLASANSLGQDVSGANAAARRIAAASNKLAVSETKAATGINIEAPKVAVTVMIDGKELKATVRQESEADRKEANRKLKRTLVAGGRRTV